MTHVRRLAGAVIALPAAVVRLLRAAWSLEPADWSAFADQLVVVLAPFEGVRSGQLALAKVLKSARRSAEAVDVCRRSLVRWPDHPATLLELGRSLRQSGDRAAAITALQEAVRHGSLPAIRELRRYGARSALPVREPGIYARTDYHAFATENPVPPPPACTPSALFRITLENASCARSAGALTEQTYPAWHLTGTAVPELAAGLFCYDLFVPGGAVLDRECLAWLAWAISQTGGGTISADHDHFESGTGQRLQPMFLPAPDFLWPESEARLVAVAATGARAGACSAHIPLVLMSLPATTGASSAQLQPDADPQALSVIIPTRDNPALLKVAIDTLLATAHRRDLVEIVVVDNGSRQPETLVLFDALAAQRNVRIVSFNEPFNWSRASNVGAEAASGQSLLFLNDDTAMLTKDWDRLLAGLLDNPAVGVVGARMVYPDGTIQHGGFVFGMDNGPQHEGRWMAGIDEGPAQRWTATRQAVAVTGAFFAVRRSDFVTLGGFDEDMFRIDFADVDFCMRSRAAGRAVAYCGAITLVHHESVSRGLNLGRRKRRRMAQEWQRFKVRWGDKAMLDPGHHPIWSRTGAPYDGMVVPDGDVQISVHRAGASASWKV
ncbi:glycosyltransferase [Novosphingobium sp. MMS21-SN21R]|uniref:glycosyltransferase family 2 protein n=1 Tax=Novosphingobium sp. MMS21-SN21R TaxID=2969298 RepID=UPI002886C761|nr:glycosyltransferase [Novosphingobium sp. MMS21-SN21R]MDT0507079.1 glycosyltransferase [Novosphingobium sp. MMS21-SN21R]